MSKAEEKSGSCRRVTLTCSRSAKGKQVALRSARVPLDATRKKLPSPL